MKNKKGKRYYTVNEQNMKIHNNTDQVIIDYLDKNDSSDFGHLWSHVNEFLPEPYKRKGFSLHLNGLISKGVIARRTYKQGHYLYYLTKKGQENISLKARNFVDMSVGLLRVHFAKERRDNDDEKYYLKRISERMGFFMLFSCIQALKQTSPNDSNEKNFGLLQEWMKESNPSIQLYFYFSNILSSFLKYRSEEEALTPVFQSKEKMKKMLGLEQKLKDLFPEEYDFCTDKINSLPRHIKNNSKMDGYIKKSNGWINRLNKQMTNAKKRELKPNECPRCHHDGKGPVKSGPYKGSKIFRGYRSHGPDNTKWCDLCHYETE
jgi:hypothetical protein